MRTHGGKATRRIARLSIIAGIAALTAALSGCSAGAEDVAYDAGADVAPGEEQVDGAAAPDGESTSIDRAIIITGELYMTVDDPIAAADKATRIVEQAGGRIDGRNESAPDDSYGGSASLTLRIPTADLDDVVDEVRALGQVDEFSTSSRDVTTEVTDLEARISTLRDSTQRIQEFLLEAKDITDIITLENELAARQAELESLEAQQRGLADQVSMSTISLSLTTEPIVIVEREGPQNFWDGLVSGWHGLVAFFSVALIVLGVLMPWLIAIALIVAAIVVPIRLRGKHRARPAAPQQATAVPPPPPPAK